MARILLIVGGGTARHTDETRRLAELVSSRGADEFIRFLGLRDDIPSVLTAFDVVFVTLALWTFEPLMTE